MPEGDTIFRAARTLHRALAGKTVVRVRVGTSRAHRVHDDAPLTGRTIEQRDAVRQAHADAFLRRPGAAHAHAHERQLAHLPARRALAAPAPRHADRRSRPTTSWPSASAFRWPSSSPRAIWRGTTSCAGSGPTCSSDDFDADEALRRLRERGRTRDRRRAAQSARAWPASATSTSRKCCSPAGVDPFAPVRTLDATRSCTALVDTAPQVLRANVIRRAARR